MTVDLNSAVVADCYSDESDCVIVGGVDDFDEELESADVEVPNVDEVVVEAFDAANLNMVGEIPVIEGGDGEDVEEVELFEDGTVSFRKKGPPIEAPTVGMVFSSMEEVDSYYRSYGEEQGFGVVRAAGSAYRGKDGAKRPLRSSTWTCDRYGRPDRKRKVTGNEFITDSQIQMDNSVSVSKKIDYCAMLYASVNVDGIWQIRTVVNEHKNHKPSRCNAKYIFQVRKRELTEHVKRRLRIGYASGMSIAQLHNMIVNERNGPNEVGLTKRDVRNELAKDKRLKLKDGDAEAMIEYFRKMTEGNQNFFHAYRVDSIGQMQDILWVDARSRAAYKEFGDVVCFDTTYLTNKYELPFANFVGVNHHGQTILLGCALISHETTETFQWVFSTWLNCMDSKPPVGILTDQAAAMRRALSIEMPESRHRWCIWHITSKFGEKLGKKKKYLKMKDALFRAIYDSLTTEEFENSWEAVIEEYELHQNSWLTGLYKEKEMWVPAYLKHLFWAGMKTTQRVESIHSFFDDYVKKHTRLYEFAESYCKAMENRAEEERRYDAHSETCVRQIVTGFPAEYVFQQCYTDMKFKEVVKECSRIGFLNCFHQRIVSENVTEFFFEDRVWSRNKDTRKEFLTQYERCYSVKYNIVTKLASCECCLFESSGIMCRHIIKLYSNLGISDVPAHYILKRWRKDVQRAHTRVKVAYHDPSKNVQVKAFDHLQLLFEPICAKAVVYKETMELVIELLQLMDIRVDEKSAMTAAELLSQTPSSVGNRNEGCTPHSTAGVAPNANSQLTPQPQRTNVKDPPFKVYPHRTTSSRYLSAAEKAVKGKGRGKGKGKGNSAAVEGGPSVCPPMETRKGRKAKAQAVIGQNEESADLQLFSESRGGPNTEGPSVDPLSRTCNGVVSRSCVNMLDPEGSFGVFRVSSGPRVLFTDSFNEGQASNVSASYGGAELNLSL